MTLTDRLERFFREHPNTWVDGKDLAAIAGSYAWRSRVSDLRQRFKAAYPEMTGDPMPNRQRRAKVKGTTRQYVVSEYMAVLP